MTEFEKELCARIIQQLGLDEIDPDSLSGKTALFGEGLLLDSIDALEIETLIAELYGIHILPAERTGSTFADITTLAQFIQTNRDRDARRAARGSAGS
jgi:acyl carrier protein